MGMAMLVMQLECSWWWLPLPLAVMNACEPQARVRHDARSHAALSDAVLTGSHNNGSWP